MTVGIEPATSPFIISRPACDAFDRKVLCSIKMLRNKCYLEFLPAKLDYHHVSYHNMC